MEELKVGPRKAELTMDKIAKPYSEVFRNPVYDQLGLPRTHLQLLHQLQQW
jgi:hypothetical protein